MKKTLIALCVVALLFSSVTVTAFAAGHGQGRKYVDADGDGICDRSDGVCNFVDADNDGICDNYTSQTPRRDGTGRGCHQGGGCRGGRGR